MASDEDSKSQTRSHSTGDIADTEPTSAGEHGRGEASSTSKNGSDKRKRAWEIVNTTAEDHEVDFATLTLEFRDEDLSYSVSNVRMTKDVARNLSSAWSEHKQQESQVTSGREVGNSERLWHGLKSLSQRMRTGSSKEPEERQSGETSAEAGYAACLKGKRE